MCEFNLRDELCARCDIRMELKRRKILIEKIFNDYQDVESESIKKALKYDIGAEGVREIFKGKCTLKTSCDEVEEEIEIISGYEERLSKLLYELMMLDREKDVYYISSDIDPFYPILSNRIVRCDKAKKASVKDSYDRVELLKQLKK